MSNSSEASLSLSLDEACFYCSESPCVALGFEQFIFHTDEIYELLKNYVPVEGESCEVSEIVSMLDDEVRSKVRGRMYYKFCE